MTVEILDEVGQHVLAYCASNSAWDSYSYGQGQTSAGASIGSGPGSWPIPNRSRPPGERDKVGEATWRAAWGPVSG
jgi:hypothetical protein